jgi:hypothetical protein
MLGECHDVLLPLLAAILFVLAGTSTVHAGQYTLAYDFAADLSFWRASR